MKKILIPKEFKSSCDLLPKIPMRMRITSILLAGFLFQAHAETLYSQSARVSLEMRNATVEEVLNEIEAKSDYYFLYNSKLINVDRKVSVSVNENSVESVLHRLFDGTDIDYKVNDKQIVLSLKTLKMNLPGIDQQKKNITGTVVDATGLPIIGANVMIKGTTNGTVTDVEGRFSLETSDDAILEVSYIGYTSYEAPVGNKSSFTITLKEDLKTLDEVVVVAYGTQNKRSVTGSMETVKLDDLSELPVGQFSQKMQGQVTGVQISQGSGRPGQGVNVRIRGAASISTTSITFSSDAANSRRIERD